MSRLVESSEQSVGCSSPESRTFSSPWQHQLLELRAAAAGGGGGGDAGVSDDAAYLLLSKSRNSCLSTHETSHPSHTSPTLPMTPPSSSCSTHHRGERRSGYNPAMSLSSSTMHDNSVMATGDDAAVSKLSAVQLGYFDDPFIKLSSHPSPLLPREGRETRRRKCRRKRGSSVPQLCSEPRLVTGTWCRSRRGARH